MVAWIGAALMLLQGGAEGVRVQRGIEVRPDTVTVGQRFDVVVRIRAPRGASIEFPVVPDSGGAVEAIDPVRLEPAASDDSAFTERRAVYRVAAWGVGSFGISFPHAVVRLGIQSQTVSLAGASVYVRSVLPADSTERVPKPARDLFTFGPPWWIWALAALAAVSMLLLLWWLWRRRRQRLPPPVDPYVVVTREFDRVEKLALVAAGERALHIALMSEILRYYLAELDPKASTSLTSAELIAALRGGPMVTPQRLLAFLNEVDLVKFARRGITPERAAELGREARALAESAHARTASEQVEQAA